MKRTSTFICGQFVSSLIYCRVMSNAKQKVQHWNRCTGQLFISLCVLRWTLGSSPDQAPARIDQVSFLIQALQSTRLTRPTKGSNRVLSERQDFSIEHKHPLHKMCYALKDQNCHPLFQERTEERERKKKAAAMACFIQSWLKQLFRLHRRPCL